MKRFLLLSVSLLFLCGISLNAQRFAVKTNALYLATATPNVGLEVALGERWTFEAEGGYNPWTFDKEKNMKAKHWLVSPEFRYWFCNSFQGHFIGINGNYTQFNVSGIDIPEVFFPVESEGAFLDQLQYSRCQGWAAGAGLVYGYAFPIARRWNMEFKAGLGWWYTVYDQFESRTCGLFQERVSRHAFGLTDLGISFIYMIK